MPLIVIGQCRNQNNNDNLNICMRHAVR